MHPIHLNFPSAIRTDPFRCMRLQLEPQCRTPKTARLYLLLVSLSKDRWTGVAMGNSVFSMSYSILQRFADAGIQPLTHHAGLAISTQFRLSEKGNQPVRDALDNLRVSYGFESVLWFGFGHKSFLRLLTERELGVSCAALCACLGETYGTPKAAELLQALWDVNDFPKDLQPSRSQFGTLVSSC